jgi:hypothetical protein
MGEVSLFMGDSKTEGNAYTVGTIRTNIIEIAKGYVSGNNVDDAKPLRMVLQEYYDTLPDGSDAQKHLKKSWDVLALEYHKIREDWRRQYEQSDELDRLDLLSQGLNDRFNYECQRYIQVKINYYHFKTYWDKDERDYSLK